MVTRVWKNGESSKNFNGKGNTERMTLQMSKGWSPCLPQSDFSRTPTWTSKSNRGGSKAFPGRRDNWGDRNPAFDPAKRRSDRPPFKQPSWGDSDSSDISDDDYPHRRPPPGQWDPPYEHGEKPPYGYGEQPPWKYWPKPRNEYGPKHPYKYGQKAPGNGRWGKVN
jgi:hypothetical protein